MSVFHPYSEQEFEAIVRGSLPLFHGMALRILKNASDAEDAVQVALVRGWNRLFFLRSSEKLIGWLGRIVINESYNIYRSRRNAHDVDLERLPETQEGYEDNQTAEQELQMQRLEDAIAFLPEIYRQTIHVGVLSGLGSDEAARILGCSTNTLYQRIHKAKQLLREAWKGE